jgi:hypothetical protein
VAAPALGAPRVRRACCARCLTFRRLARLAVAAPTLGAPRVVGDTLALGAAERRAADALDARDARGCRHQSSLCQVWQARGQERKRER